MTSYMKRLKQNRETPDNPFNFDYFNVRAYLTDYDKTYIDTHKIKEQNNAIIIPDYNIIYELLSYHQTDRENDTISNRFYEQTVEKYP